MTAIPIGKAGDAEIMLDLAYANRHGLIAGATGTGKTVTLQVLAEGFARAGVPVFAADIKGDLSGIAAAGADKDFLIKRAAEMGLADYKGEATGTVFWDVFGAAGHPVRATVSEMGPLLLSRLLDLNATQEGVVNIAFRLADDDGELIDDMATLRALLGFVGEQAKSIKVKYGNVSPASIGAIQRGLLTLDTQGADHFFGQPALKIGDLMRTGADGRGLVSILAADNLMQSPRVYATFLLWLLSELFEELPEAGDLPKPKLVFFFDEAHLLFSDAPKHLVERIVQVVRLIRSKGVGVYFVTQNPQDIPEMVLAQLGCRIQHALRAYTPKEQKAVRVAAESFRANPAFDTEETIGELAVGEALVTTLGKGGVPSMVERTKIRPPVGRIGPVTLEERAAAILASPIGKAYDRKDDHVSSYEGAKKKPPAPEPEDAQDAEPEARTARERTWGEWFSDIFTGGGGRRQGLAEAMAKSAARSAANSLGRQLVRNVLGGLSGR